MIKFKESAKNENYGKIKTKDEFNRERNLDLLDLKLEYAAQELTVRELLTILAQYAAEIKQLKEIIDAQEKAHEDIKNIKKLLIIHNGKIEKLK